MIEALGYILIFLVGYFWGWKLREAVAIRNLDKILENAEETTDVSAMTVYLHVEPHEDGDQLYLYNKEDDSFLVQGKTKEELIGFLKKNYPYNDINMRQKDVEKLSQYESKSV
jgi:hypothetical protein